MNDLHPENYIRSREELEVALLLGGDLYVVFEDSFLVRFGSPYINREKLVSDKALSSTKLENIGKVIENNTAYPVVFYEHESAWKWSTKLFRARVNKRILTR